MGRTALAGVSPPVRCRQLQTCGMGEMDICARRDEAGEIRFGGYAAWSHSNHRREGTCEARWRSAGEPSLLLISSAENPAFDVQARTCRGRSVMKAFGSGPTVLAKSEIWNVAPFCRKLAAACSGKA
ncbi:hypothetical protein AAFF_G00000260 [Aldrovandia affinis]|uniref:Uncharacterized protein n=1 Tax=Aldrovandia affinis TaxID=143900 RepID=A0AAD7X2W9_9TELE|nr:hypothetical protein AAFF_G00000260 [Aldrovandia affinis]